MGRGIALQAKERFYGLALNWGRTLRDGKNIPIFDPRYRLVSFPVKHHWNQKADMDLIAESAKRIVAVMDDAKGNTLIAAPAVLYMPRPGCGNGGLLWEDVRLLLSAILDDRFIIVERD